MPLQHPDCWCSAILGAFSVNVKTGGSFAALVSGMCGWRTQDSVLSVICPQQRHQLWLRSARCQGGRCQAQHGESWRQSSAWRWAAAGCWLRINASIEGHGGQWVVLGRAGARQQPRGRHWQPQTIATHTLTRETQRPKIMLSPRFIYLQGVPEKSFKV